MKLNKTILLISIIFFIFGCAYKPMPYQKAVGWIHGGHGGYLDKELKPGLHLIEVQNISDQSSYYEEIIANFRRHWHRRALELCPKGYIGEPEIIQPYQARMDSFRCNLNLCNWDRMLSGIIRCNDKT